MPMAAPWKKPDWLTQQRISGVLVQEMLEDGIECTVAIKRDTVFGRYYLLASEVYTRVPFGILS